MDTCARRYLKGKYYPKEVPRDRTMVPNIFRKYNNKEVNQVRSPVPGTGIYFVNVIN